MMNFPTLIDMLRGRGESQRKVHFIDGENDERSVTFADLIGRAQAFLHALQSRGIQPGDELVIFTNRNEDFLVAFWGAILGGIVPVPIAVGISDEHRLKVFRILRQLQRASIYSDPDLLRRLHKFAGQQDDSAIRQKLTDNAITNDDVVAGERGAIHTAAPDDLAFIQYSSGSTSDPKGVCLTHGNICSTVAGIIRGLQLNGSDRTFSWMPLTHDMGLIGYHITVLLLGIDHAIMETSVFVRRPLLWLQKADEQRSTVLCSPNFGYKHFLKVYERKGIDDLDLSRVRLILNGAEPISVGLCEEFLAAMSRHGLDRKAMFPVYGLAEATLAVTFPKLGKDYSFICVDRHSLRVGEPYREVDIDHHDALRAVRLGTSIDGCEVRISGDDDAVLPNGRIGHVQIRGANVTRGIYGDREDAAGLYTKDGWLRTGDCGVLVDGELVITGRKKDIVIINGQNYYPHDIEEVVSAVDGLDLGKVVVCGAQARDSQVEQLLVFLLYRKDAAAFAALADRVRTRIGTQTGLEVDYVIPVARIPKTTSGKVQRAILAQAFVDGEYDDFIRQQEKNVQQDIGADEADPIVRELESICAEFSKDKVIKPDDNLFEVGISSLTLTEIMLAVDEKYPGRVDINDLFDYPTLRDLAGFLREGAARETS